MTAADVVLFPDAGPLITLAYADALDLLYKPGWTVGLVDMVLEEVTRSQTPTSDKIARWAKGIHLLETKTCQHYREEQQAGNLSLRKAHLGELAVQEALNAVALLGDGRRGVFLFEDHRIARASFLIPDNCQKVSTRAYLLFLERKGWIESAAEIERAAIMAGRAFSRLRFPPE